MQVHGVKSGIVCASNGGCGAFDINRSLAEGVMELNRTFVGSSLATLALGIIAMQKNSSNQKHGFGGNAEILSNLEI
jgi:hypothetical protein